MSGIEFLVNLNQESIISLITCLMTVTASVITIFITVSNSNRNQRQAIELQNQHFEDSLIEQEKIYNLTRDGEELRNRISMMPYFKIIDDIKVTEETTSIGHTILEFPINLINIGNGTAINIFPVSEERAHESFVYMGKYADKEIKYKVNSPVYDNIARCNEYAKFGIYCNKHEFPSEVFFKIRFKDMMERTYEQKFFFQYKFGSYHNEVLRVESYTPILVEDTTIL